METINIPAGSGTPAITLDFASSTFSFKGESYPEDVNTFYGKIIDTLSGFVTAQSGGHVTIIMHLVYFNSSSTKVFHNMFQMLESAMDSNNITASVDWLYHEDDDMSQEFAEGFKEDFERITFNMVAHD